MAEFSSLNGYTVKDAIARNIAKGRNQALAYADYATMVETLNAMDNEQFKVGQNIYIGTVGVPDLWVYSIEPVLHDYNHVSDEATVELLKNNGTIQVGYYKLAMLEGQKVDLTPVNEQLAANTNAIAANTNAISEQNKNLGGLRFGVDGDGNGGYYKADDSFVPFKGGFKKFEFSYAGTGRSNISVDISSLPNYKSITLDDIFIGMTMVNADLKTGPNTIENVSYNQSNGIVSFDSVYDTYRSLRGYVVVSA